MPTGGELNYILKIQFTQLGFTKNNSDNSAEALLKQFGKPDVLERYPKKLQGTNSLNPAPLSVTCEK